MLGYWQRPDATDEVLKDGWLATGDVVTVDDQGFVRIVDRKKDMIRSPVSTFTRTKSRTWSASIRRCLNVRRSACPAKSPAKR